MIFYIVPYSDLYVNNIGHPIIRDNPVSLPHHKKSPKYYAKIIHELMVPSIHQDKTVAL